MDKQSYGDQVMRWKYNLQAGWKKAEPVVLFSTERGTPAFFVRLGRNVQRYGLPGFRGTDDGVGYPQYIQIVSTTDLRFHTINNVLI